MRYILAIILAAALLPAKTLYILEWHSAQPIAPETLTATVTGGTLIAAVTVEDGTAGWVEADAPLACLTIEARAQTTAGIAVRFVRGWDAGCLRVWLPWISARADTLVQGHRDRGAGRSVVRQWEYDRFAPVAVQGLQPAPKGCYQGEDSTCGATLEHPCG